MNEKTGKEKCLKEFIKKRISQVSLSGKIKLKEANICF